MIVLMKIVKNIHGIWIYKLVSTFWDLLTNNIPYELLKNTENNFSNILIWIMVISIKYIKKEV